MSTRHPLIINAFDLAAANHLSPGLWRDPDDRQGREYTSAVFWINLAKALDDAGFDALFLADGYGVPSAYQGSSDSALGSAVQTPRIDPVPIVSMLASHTRRLGFGVTVSTTYTEPYATARLLTSLDHLSGGRVGWNIVTSSSAAAASLFGLDEIPAHQSRYERAEEFVDVAYQLWEGSWQDDALILDAEADRYIDPSKIRPVEHAGEHFNVRGIFAAPPSPQVTPLLFQAGSSAAGLAFAGRHAEVIFLAGNSAKQIRDEREAILEQADAAGRRPSDLRFLSAITVVTGATAAEAAEKFERYRSLASFEGGLTLLSGWTGIDWSTYDLDAPIEYLPIETHKSMLKELAGHYGDRTWTLREAAEYVALGGLRPVLTGDPVAVADQIEELVDATGVDGFNLANIVSPTSYLDFIEYIIPQLRRRGLFRPEGATGTLRSQIFGTDRVPTRHPAARYRRTLAGEVV
ncbi:NtaA/DmoA family FMN-dependent monooxygenase [Gordonia sp. ABSL11-1]|uniref:NtaA/DmoA family FMN-dependent monooxygenase n=1 Tax=Gordonia sp. ABSL11-1 TaxID=3053924 RepID=UPI0025744C46|nr:NtaA/DmoA family FMN-dependent monooxygenase [Gordonia sp. ABSL11-1]MDL9948139.1 NtaA/DmoA family FMN-dependent monooxygenase [Gordonia sp. ABSL11-1]